MTPSRSARSALAVRVLLVLLAFAVGGVLAGVVWHALWTPPTGLYLGEQWHVDSEGAPRDVAGTGLYVVVAATAGIVLGFAVSLLARGHEVVTLVAVTVGSALAGLLMAVTGNVLGPDDPRPQAAGKPDFTAEVADLRVEGRLAVHRLPRRGVDGARGVVPAARRVDVGILQNASRRGTGRVVSTSDRHLSNGPHGPVTTGGARHVQQPAAVRPGGPVRAAVRPHCLARW